jgi:hypothetical protein
MIEDGVYFTLKAPYQSGKTTLAKELVREINGDGRYYALYLNLSELKGTRNLSLASGIFADILIDALRVSKEPAFGELRLKKTKKPVKKTARYALSELCSYLDKPLVLVIDEIYGLSPAIVGFLAEEFFAGFVTREKSSFPHSVMFLSVRDLFDLGEDREERGGGGIGESGIDGTEEEEERSFGGLKHTVKLRGGAFNIFKTIRLPNFSFADIAKLCDEHNVATGQLTDDAAKLKIWDYTEGQPFLVNALISEAADFILNGELGKTITAKVISEAALNIARERPAHLRYLMSFLKYPGVRRIVGEALSGASLKRPLFDSGALLALDLGLLSVDQDDYLRPANRLYRDLTLRALTEHIELPRSLYGRFYESDTILMSPLLAEFQRYWRERGEGWLRPFPEIPGALTRLSLQIFLKRALGDEVLMEKAMAVKEESLVLTISSGGRYYPLMTVISRPGSSGDSEAEEISAVMDAKGASEGWILRFDLRAGKTFEERTYWKTRTLSAGRIVHVAGL